MRHPVLVDGRKRGGFHTGDNPSDNHVFISGLYTGELTFGSAEISSNGGTDLLVARLDL